MVLRFVRGPRLLGVRAAVTRARMAVRAQRTLEPVDGELKLHLGCGDVRIEGWRNVDLAGSQADFVWDLRKPLPVRPGTVSAVFNEHFLEHLPLADAMGAIRQSYELLAPGGIIRIGVPDFRRYFEDYVASGAMIDNARPGRPTVLVALNEVIYSYGHTSLWDAPTLIKLLSEIGFVDVRERAFRESALDPAPDTELRSRHSPTLYIEAVKP
jgi:predicted SAM-dependent methyltransferase